LDQEKGKLSKDKITKKNHKKIKSKIIMFDANSDMVDWEIPIDLSCK